MLNRLDGLLKKYPAAANWLLILAAVVFYRGVLACGYVLDDTALILQNPYVKNPHLWKDIFTTPMWAFLGHAGESSYYRPLGIFMFWLICRVGGLNPVGYHFFQLFLYVLAVFMVYQVGRKLLPTDLAAFGGALLWALHPAHVEPVAWASAIPDIACGFFCLLGFWFFLRAEAQSPPALRHHILAAAVFAPALFCKELAFTFPLLILAYWFCFSGGVSWTMRALQWLPYATAMAACAAIRVAAMGRFAGRSLFHEFKPRVAWVAIGLLGEHAKVFIWPVGLTEFRDFRLAASLESPWPWIVLLVLALAVAGRKRQPLLSFLVLWWLVLLLPCLDYRQLSFPFVEDQFSYLPSVGLCLALGYLAFVVAPRRYPMLVLAPAVLGALLVLGAFWASLILRAMPRWGNNDTLLEYSLRVSPNAALAHVSHGATLQLRDHDLEGAAREFRTALELNAQSIRPILPVDYDSYIGLGQVAQLQGRDAEALDYFNKAVHLLPNFSFAYNVLGSYYFPRGDYARAAEYFRQAVRATPMEMGSRFYLGTCLLKLDKPREAAGQFRAAREVDPEFREAYMAEAMALETAGDKSGAAEVRRLLAGHQGE